jgi:thiamine biosynthesis lipoprotein
MPNVSTCLSRLRIAMGTFVAVEAEASSAAAAERGITAAFEAILAVERLMHPTRTGSDLAALAGCPPGTPLKVHPWTWGLLHLCRLLGTASGGIFDPCLESAPGRVGDLVLATQGYVVPQVRVHVDAGGIAKGYAVDRAIEALRAAGCEGGLVNAGGDLAVFGARRRRILCHAASGAHVALELGGAAAVATSHTGPAPRPREHRGYYHGIDRRRAVSGCVTVIAASAAVADAVTKCALIGEPDRQMLASFGAVMVPGRNVRTPAPIPDLSG